MDISASVGEGLFYCFLMRDTDEVIQRHQMVLSFEPVNSEPQAQGSFSQPLCWLPSPALVVLSKQKPSKDSLQTTCFGTVWVPVASCSHYSPCQRVIVILFLNQRGPCSGSGTVRHVTLENIGPQLWRVDKVLQRILQVQLKGNCDLPKSMWGKRVVSWPFVPSLESAFRLC